MANTQSAKKRMRQNVKRRMRNRTVMSRMRNYLKQARLALEGEDITKSEEAVLKAVSELDRAASKGVIHKKNAARHKSRLMTRLARIQAEAKEAA